MVLVKFLYVWDLKYFAFPGSVGLGHRLWKWIDMAIIDGVMVNGTARLVAGISTHMRKIQSGYLYHYVFDWDIFLLPRFIRLFI